MTLNDDCTSVEWLRTKFSVSVQATPGLVDYVKASGTALLRYDELTQTLTVTGKLTDTMCRKLFVTLDGSADSKSQKEAINELKNRSSLFVSDDELIKLERYIKRTRCECLFASSWILVEGPADRDLVHAMAQGIQKGLDEHGVSVVDVKQNASPRSFVILAQALGIEWVGVFDRDSGGKEICDEICSIGGADEDFGRNCREHSKGDLEEELITDERLFQELREILVELGEKEAPQHDRCAVAERLRKCKRKYAERLASRFRNDPSLAERGPKAFLWAIERLCR